MDGVIEKRGLYRDSTILGSFGFSRKHDDNGQYIQHILLMERRGVC